MVANPTLLSMPIAENGTKNTIPETQATPGNGLMSQSTGFPAECSLPLGAGGTAPDRADFNGAFYLLGGVAFMAQKGFTFNYDATQDYYTGCVVIDNGNRYLCIADMAAGTVAPSADTTHDYWIFYPVGVINKRDIVTTSGAYTAPVTGWYKISVKGGGGGGAGGFKVSAGGMTYGCGGGGGGEGGTTTAYEYITAGDTVTVTIGAGGTGGVQAGGYGGNGGASSVVVNGNTYTGGGGVGGSIYTANNANYYGQGGTGTIPGACGGSPLTPFAGSSSPGNCGGGNGGGAGGNITPNTGNAGTLGGGGGGGGGLYSDSVGGRAGGNGGDGYATFEYFAEV